MPPKRQNNTRQQGSVEVAQKVKEIKQRQQNWFKQREQSTSSGRADESYHTDEPILSANMTGGHGDQSYSKAHGFNAWMKARNKDEKPALREQRKTPLGASYVISKDSEGRAREDDQKLSAASASQMNHQGSDFSASLAPDDFDQLADQILNRVKKELNGKPYYAKQYEDLNSSARNNTNSLPYHKPSDPDSVGLSSEVSVSLQMTPSPDSSIVASSSERLPSDHPKGHLCPQCSRIMIGDHEPMLIIPCGHNICKACSELEDVDLCVVCSCEVGSFTSNIMLKQIIADFRRDRKRKGSSRKLGSSRSGLQDGADDKDYKEEIKTLMLRLDVLETESDNIKEVMNSIHREMVMEQKQVANIEKQEDKVKQEIEELNAKLDALSNHKQSYFDRCDTLEQKSSKQEEKLNMVKDTIRQLNREVEKLQLTGGGDR